MTSLRLLVAAAIAAGLVAAPAVPATSPPAGPPTAGQVLAALNAVRSGHHLPALRLSRPLSAAAAFHTADMGRQGYFSHSDKDGKPFWKRIRRFYRPDGFSAWAAGENLLWSGAPLDAAGAIKLWMHSPGHRANILRRAWREVGISAQTFPAAPGVFRGLRVTIVTTDFGARL